MDVTAIISGVLNGGLMGIAGNAVTAWIRWRDRKLEIEQQRQQNEFEIQKLERMANIDRDKAEMALKQETERGQAAGFAAAASAEGAIRGEHKWATTVRALWRPTLTAVLLVLTAIVFFTLEPQNPARDMIASAIVTCATSAVLFWFGSRSLEKFSIAPRK